MSVVSETYAPTKEKTGVLFKEGRVSEASALFLDAVPESQRTAAHDYVLGNLLFNLDRELSARLHESAFKKAPEQPFVKLEWAIELHRLRNYEEAEKLYGQLLSESATAPMKFVAALRADCLLHLDRYADAVAAWVAADPAKWHTKIEQVASSVYGDISPATRRSRLLARVAKRELGAAERLILLDLHWDRDWWNSRRNQEYLDHDLVIVADALGKESARYRQLDFLLQHTPGRDIFEAEPAAVNARALRASAEALGLLGEKAALAEDTAVAAQIFGVLLDEKITSRAALRAQFEAPLLERAKAGAGDVEALNILANLCAGDRDRLAEIDRHRLDSWHRLKPTPRWWCGTQGACDAMDSCNKTRSVCQALPTNRHVGTLFDMVANMLGSAAVVFEEGAVRHLCHRDPDRRDLYLPWPHLRLAVGDRASLGEYVGMPVRIYGGDPDAAPPPEPQPLIAKPPRLRGLAPGQLEIGWGEGITFHYAEDGIAGEIRHHLRKGPDETPLLDRLYEAVVAGAGTESLAEVIAGLAPSSLGPGRAMMPRPAGLSPLRVWRSGLRAMRRALWSREPARTPVWCVVDGFDGSVFAEDPQYETAIAKWRKAIEINPPGADYDEKVKAAAERPEPEVPPGMIMLSTGPGPRPPSLADMPACTLLVSGGSRATPPRLLQAAGFDRWKEMIGEHGEVAAGLIRVDSSGWVLIGEDVLDQVDPSEIDPALDEIEIEANANIEQHINEMRQHSDFEYPEPPPWFLTSADWTAGRPGHNSYGRTERFDAASLNADVVRKRVMRLRYREPDKGD